MRFKLILAFVEDSKTDSVLDAARTAGATGATVINNARGEGLNKKANLLWTYLRGSKRCAAVCRRRALIAADIRDINQVGEFDQTSGQGIAVQIDIEDAVGVATPSRDINQSGRG